MAMRIRHNACPACGNGDLHPLGRLGFLEHYQCRHCGMQTSREIRKVRARRKIEGHSELHEPLATTIERNEKLLKKEKHAHQKGG